MMLSFGPLVWATTSPVTVTPASALASLVTSAPSTTSSAGRLMLAPASPVSFSTSTTSPTATLYCLPPVLTMAYTVRLLDHWSWGSRAQPSATCRGYRTPPAPSNARRSCVASAQPSAGALGQADVAEGGSDADGGRAGR